MLALPLVAFLGVIVFLLIRSGDLPIWQVVLVSLFGFYLDRTHAAAPVSAVVAWIVRGFTHT
jgi:hypothetical protein